MNAKLYVGGISFSSTDDSLKSFFASAGTVKEAKIITDRETGRSRGFGFVEMSTDEEAQKAIETLNGQELDGRKLRIDIARPLAPRGDRGGSFGNRDR